VSDGGVVAALGIAYIRERKHVHGDVKPNNILLDNNWDSRVLDFGLQRLLSLLGPVAGKEGELKKKKNLIHREARQCYLSPRHNKYVLV
jgi:serine/threonine protein kinase